MWPPGFPELALALCGLCIGSFLNVCIHRLPSRTSIVFPASRCPACAHVLAWSDNIPLGSMRRFDAAATAGSRFPSGIKSSRLT